MLQTKWVGRIEVIDVIRWLLGLCALPFAGYGVWLLLSRQDLDQLTNAGLWLVSGVVAHDLAHRRCRPPGLVWPSRVLPAVSRAPAAVAAGRRRHR